MSLISSKPRRPWPYIIPMISPVGTKNTVDQYLAEILAKRGRPAYRKLELAGLKRKARLTWLTPDFTSRTERLIVSKL
jgi:hypothetical protein